MVFLGVLVVGLAYVWKKGDLDWVRAQQHGDKPVKRDLMPRRRVTAASGASEQDTDRRLADAGA